MTTITYTICRVCGASESLSAFPAAERMFGNGEVFDYFQCGKCGTVQIAEVPDNLGYYYQSDSYYSFNNLRREQPLKALVKRVVAANIIGRPQRYPRGHGMIDRLRRGCQPWIATIPGLTLQSRILDVGCGEGARLDDLARLGFTDLAGIDMFLPETAVGTRPNGVRLMSGDLADHDGQYDLITMHHSLEHVPDPRALLVAARERLAPGGSIFVRIPLLQPDIWSRFGVDWVQLDPPRHLYLFAPDAFRAYAASAGLGEVGSGTDTMGWSLAWSEAYRKGIPMVGVGGKPNPLPFTAEEMARFEAEAEALNAADKGDQGYFVLQPA
ncbi:hypothetical protein CHX26_14750 [Porphyrobacter sp. HT-58-2]|uniref:class I SAM-dependent methyltransferase n=1 Tax=Porphyrobacter sp. HT-58-2 TaxID=2023229 RepID=UPI000CDBAC1F|nr:class I SAM-dependent methyltransferase [Porphyrobacter sp. HT-58-2]AUX70588.1 hypothetical protein CHX26_14750 [Porphyrobacter sp. HT-58-2]